MRLERTILPLKGRSGAAGRVWLKISAPRSSLGAFVRPERPLLQSFGRTHYEPAEPPR